MNQENYDLEIVKDVFKMQNYGDDIRAWLAANPGKTALDFANLCGVSRRTIDSILAYRAGDPNTPEPNPRKDTLKAIVQALGCEAKYFPQHKIR